MSRARLPYLLVTAATVLTGSAWAAPTHVMREQADGACGGTSLSCATAATPFVDARGRLWLAWAANGSVMVARSPDGGRRFDPATEVGRPGALLDTGADARPQIVVLADNHVVVAYGAFKDQKWNAQVWLAWSDDGRHYSAPRSLSADSASQRFPSLAADRSGTVTAVWLDKRTAAANRRRGFRQPGAAVVIARSADGGRSFGAERIVQDRSCECCRLALALDPQGRAVVAFRNIFDDKERDHAIVTIERSGTVRAVHRVAADHWALDVCPHHGPAAAVGADGVYHVAWFTQGSARQGTFYARSTDAGVTFSAPQLIGHADRMAGRPNLLTAGRDVWLVWKEYDGTRSAVWQRHSSDSGEHWSAAQSVATTAGYADHPLLLQLGGRVQLSWLTRDEGYRILPLEKP